MAPSYDTISQLLVQGTTNTRQLIEKFRVSQPTVSRALKELGADVVQIGAGPSIQYALHDSYRGVEPAFIYRNPKPPAS